MTIGGMIGLERQSNPRTVMPTDPLTTFLVLLKEIFRPALTQPSFNNLVILACGWVLLQGPHHTVAAALVAGKVAGLHHHEAFYRFFSRAAWDPDAVGYSLFRRIEEQIGSEPLRVVIDDTLAPKKGPHIFGIGTHLGPVRSTRAYRVLSFGHVWVVLSILIRVPFSSRLFALPVLFRLFSSAAPMELVWQKTIQIYQSTYHHEAAFKGKSNQYRVPVGTALAGRPPDRSRRADFPHRAPTFGLRSTWVAVHR